MPVSNLCTFKVGTATVSKLYLGSTLVWQPATGGSGETFDGANGTPWPSPWTGAVGTVTQQDGTGRIATGPGIYDQAFIRRSAPDDAEILFRWKATTGLSSVDIAIRCAGVNYGDNPKWAFRMLADRIWLTGTTGLLAEATGLAHAVGTWYWARIRWQGTTVQGRTWQDGTTEPGSWLVQATSAGSPTSGNLIFRVENGDSTPDITVFDEIQITDLGGGSIAARVDAGHVDADVIAA